MIRRAKAYVKGIVQGIGFRPFIYNQALRRNLYGYIINTSDGVEIDIEGNSAQLDDFFCLLQGNPLPLAHITSVEKTFLQPARYTRFEIKQSVVREKRATLISPDICVCDDCLREMHDPADRRYRYPFINCTNCGPRYTIINDIPYDRPATSMRAFKMCTACLEEYHNPEDRRFHAQPNACPECGPRIELYDAERKHIDTADVVSDVQNLLQQGYILAIKGLGGFHFAVDATNRDAVARLRDRKQREEKPFALMSLNSGKVKSYANMTDDELSLLASPQRPIVLLQKKFSNMIAANIAPVNDYYGVMLPYTPLHYLLLDFDCPALVMTSANISDEPIAIDNDEAFQWLGGIADYFLVHNRDIYLRSDDSIVRRIQHENRIIRRSRGFVPVPVFLKTKMPSILACGAELKNTICLTRNDCAFLSQHIGDLKNKKSYDFLNMTVDHLKRILDIQPDIIAHDLHPNYLSTQYALEQEEGEKIAIQHHHAHIVSCMAEHGLEGPVIGLSFDGTGYGTDGKIWGGEFLGVEGADFKRLAHFEYIKMPGGDAVIKQPWRMALSYLSEIFSERVDQPIFPFYRKSERHQFDIVKQMLYKNINCPLTSSLGRLFDGVAALTGICQHVSYEGQAAIMLEMLQSGSNDLVPYDMHWKNGADGYQIEIRPLIRQIVDDILHGETVPDISRKFHLGLIRLCSNLVVKLGNETGVKNIVLSGGVFQNATLLTGIHHALEKNGMKVFSHRQVPANDGGIALGQAVIAARMQG